MRKTDEKICSCTKKGVILQSKKNDALRANDDENENENYADYTDSR